MGRGGRRRTEIDVAAVVLNPGRSPQTLTPLLEPWLHHNDGPGGPPGRLRAPGRFLRGATCTAPHTGRAGRRDGWDPPRRSERMRRAASAPRRPRAVLVSPVFQPWICQISILDRFFAGADHPLLGGGRGRRARPKLGIDLLWALRARAGVGETVSSRQGSCAEGVCDVARKPF